MPRTYAPEVKEKFLSAAKAARAAGGDWDGVLKAAKEAGYKGGMGGLRLWIYSKGKRRKAAVKAAAPAKRAGRQPKAAAVPAGGLAQIEAIVAAEVQKRLKAAKDAALKALTKALGV